MAIFGIQDRSQNVTWKFLLGVAVMMGGMFALDRWAPGAKRAIIWSVAGMTAAFIISLMIYVNIQRRHPKFKIVRLLQEKKIDEACELGASLLVKTPDDPVVQINCAAAYVAAGNLEKARQILGTMKKDRLQGVLLKAHASLEAQLNPTKPA